MLVIAVHDVKDMHSRYEGRSEESKAGTLRMIPLLSACCQSCFSQYQSYERKVVVMIEDHCKASERQSARRGDGSDVPALLTGKGTLTAC